MMAMESSPFLPLPEGMIIGQVEITAAQLTVEVISTQPFARCPGCGNLSDHVHCQYQRTVRDVPCGGRTIVLRLCVRKFACWTTTCPRKVCAERLPDLVQPWARVSKRLLEELKAIGLAAEASGSERLAPRLGMKVKAPTLLSYLRTIPAPSDTPVRVLGVDDSALKEASPSSPGSGESLNNHTGTLTTRVSEGKLQAERTDQPEAQVEPELPNALVGQEIELASLTSAERKQKSSRDKRSARYEHILALHRAGMSGRAIARALYMSRRIVQRYLSSDGFPERAPGSGRRAFGKSKLDPYRGYLRERWNAGEHSGSHLFAEIKEHGYTGS